MRRPPSCPSRRPAPEGAWSRGRFAPLAKHAWRGSGTRGRYGGRVPVGPEFDAVLAAAQAGAEWAVAVLFRDLQPALLRYLRSHLGNDAAADDAAAEVWLAVARHLPGFRGDEGAFRGWTFTIARRRVIEERRRASRRRTDPVPQDALADRAAPDDVAEEGIAELSAKEAIARLTAGLPADMAEVVRLRVVAGLEVAEVARIMGRSPGSVRVLQHRALRRVAARLEAEGRSRTGRR